MQKNVIVLVVVAVLLAVSLYFIYPPGSSTNLGLDLQGGLAVLLEAQDSAKAPRTEESMKQAITIIEDRVNGLGVAEPEIQRQGQWKISVQLPGIDESARGAGRHRQDRGARVLRHESVRNGVRDRSGSPQGRRSGHGRETPRRQASGPLAGQGRRIDRLVVHRRRANPS